MEEGMRSFHRLAFSTCLALYRNQGVTVPPTCLPRSFSVLGNPALEEGSSVSQPGPLQSMPGPGEPTWNRWVQGAGPGSPVHCQA